MSARRADAMHDVEVEVRSGRLRWGYDAVKSLIAPYPKRGCLDVTLEFQDDEEVVHEDDGSDPWADGGSEGDSDDDKGDDNDDDAGEGKGKVKGKRKQR